MLKKVPCVKYVHFESILKTFQQTPFCSVLTTYICTSIVQNNSLLLCLKKYFWLLPFFFKRVLQSNLKFRPELAGSLV